MERMGTVVDFLCAVIALVVGVLEAETFVEEGFLACIRTRGYAGWREGDGSERNLIGERSPAIGCSQGLNNGRPRDVVFMTKTVFRSEGLQIIIPDALNEVACSGFLAKVVV